MHDSIDIEEMLADCQLHSCFRRMDDGGLQLGGYTVTTCRDGRVVKSEPHWNFVVVGPTQAAAFYRQHGMEEIKCPDSR